MDPMPPEEGGGCRYCVRLPSHDHDVDCITLIAKKFKVKE